MRRMFIIGSCALLIVGGIAIGRYAIPSTSGPRAAAAITPTTSTTTTTAPNALPQGRYNIEGFTGMGLFLDVIDGAGHQVSINVTSVGADGSQAPIAQMQGTAIDGTLTLTTNVCDVCDPPVVSASYGTGADSTGRASIYFGAAANGCGAWGGPQAALACEFTYAPTEG